MYENAVVIKFIDVDNKLQNKWMNNWYIATI